MGPFNYPGLLVKMNLESDKDGSLFGGCLWWLWYSREQKNIIPIGYTYGK